MGPAMVGTPVASGEPKPGSTNTRPPSARRSSGCASTRSGRAPWSRRACASIPASIDHIVDTRVEVTPVPRISAGVGPGVRRTGLGDAGFGRSGIPLYLFYPANGRQEAVILPQILSVDLVLQVLREHTPEQAITANLQ